ncbi:hypothetical protein SARC_06622 [Sphaeroforma arctica JP610]|uniref:GATA-type domain-containing protein n=1 Tax=Sphaeroforma arctica JP610 TaxID=667725 RepID=A0A0L0FYI8_9EUKA|nr:hypothetical protein SARC_06622 [Sphaeroforma arctica JP610]KNC81028.1 hypothetical protein SARC_06622 [Sphaeroforma arctica JP610]|eukprot:XP_014154930.1 hypothetical protein SARC_06622 [Sphaeroforma arctica JP610]
MVFAKNLSFGSSYPKTELHALSALNSYHTGYVLSNSDSQNGADGTLHTQTHLKDFNCDDMRFNVVDSEGNNLYTASSVEDAHFNIRRSQTADLKDSLETILQSGHAGQLALWTVLNGIKALNTESALGIPIVFATKKGDENLVRALVVHGANINGSGADDITALHWAIAADNISMVTLLCSLGANRYSCLSEAILKGNSEIIDIMTSDQWNTPVGNLYLNSNIHSGESGVGGSVSNKEMNLHLRRNSASALDGTATDFGQPTQQTTINHSIAQSLEFRRETKHGAGLKRCSTQDIRSPMLNDATSVDQHRPAMDVQTRSARTHAFQIDSIQSPANNNSIFGRGPIEEEASTLSGLYSMPTHGDILNQFPNMHIKEEVPTFDRDQQTEALMHPRYESVSPPGGESIGHKGWDMRCESRIQSLDTNNIKQHSGGVCGPGTSAVSTGGEQNHLVQRRRSASLHKTQIKNRNRRSMPAIDFSQSRGPYDSLSTPSSPLILERRNLTRTLQNLIKSLSNGLHNAQHDFARQRANEGASTRYQNITSAHLFESLHKDDLLLSSRASMLTSTHDSLCGQMNSSTLKSASQTPKLPTETTMFHKQSSAVDFELNRTTDQDMRMMINTKSGGEDTTMIGSYKDGTNNSYNMGISGLMHLSGLSGPSSLAQMPGQRSCCVCGTTETPQWRRDGNQPLCNACGLKQAHSKNRQAKNAKRREHYKLKKAEALHKVIAEN